MGRSAELVNNLPLLQNLIKKDPQTYREDFLQQKGRFERSLKRFLVDRNTYIKDLDQVTMFLAQVSQKYPEEQKEFPLKLMSVLSSHTGPMDSTIRTTFCKALILMRNQHLLEPTDLIELFFKLLESQDKELRVFLESHIITDLKNINAKHKNAKTNSLLQNFMFSRLQNADKIAARMAVNIMIELYKKNVWNDAKTVNVLATGCFSNISKVMVGCLKFFLGTDPEAEKDNSDSEEEIDPKEVAMANRFNKKSRKREKQLDKVKKLAAKQKKKKSAGPVFNFSALQLVHDPQGMAEKLFKRVDEKNHRLELKLLMLDVISRLIGLHDLFLLSFYPYIQRFLQPHQKEVTKFLQFVAQASHELVPPEVIEPVLKTIANNFITERNSSDVMAIGLNAVREICARCPLAMNEDLLQDLTEYKSYRDRSVMMAAKSLIQLFRNTRPDLLHKKDRGKPTEASQELEEKAYGQVVAKDYVPGAEVLLNNEETDESENNSNSESEDDSEWVDVKHSSDEGGDDSEQSGDEEGDETTLDESKEDSQNDDECEDKEGDITSNENDTIEDRKVLKAKRIREKKELAQKATLDRILTDEDFKRIDKANLKKHITYAKKGKKRAAEEVTPGISSGLVKLGDIENIYKKRKHDKQTRIDTVRQGQEDREKFGYKDGRMNINCSKTNREKQKKKNFQMVKHKLHGRVKSKSFKEKQIALRNHLLKLKRMK